MNKNLLLIVVFPIFLISCSNENKKINKTDLLPKQHDSISSTKEDFDSFFAKFNSDSGYQISRIRFPLEINVSDGNSESKSYINIDKWRFTQLVSQNELKSIIEKKIVNANEVRVVYMIKGTGVYVSHFFKYESNKWVLSYIKDESD